MTKHLLFVFIGAVVCSSVLIVLFGGVQPNSKVSADMSECTPPLTAGDGGSKRPDKAGCYECKQTGVAQDNGTQQTQQQSNSAQQSLQCDKKYDRAGADDSLRCPSGTYRGWNGSEAHDSSKCYRCNSYTDCNDAGGEIYATPDSWDVCLFTTGNNATPDQDCVNKNRANEASYESSVQNGAPGGSKYNLSRDSINPSGSAKEFCEYYKTEREDRWPWQMLRDACYVGYEIGYGKNAICSDRYLGLIAPPPYAQYPNKYARSVHTYLMNLKKGNNKDGYVYGFGTGTGVYEPGKYQPYTDQSIWDIRKKISGKIIDACYDGYTQYTVDYFFCGGDSGCTSNLRSDQSRIFDPGFRPQRTTNSSDPNTPGALLPQVPASATYDCGGTATAYFTCSGGDTVGTSAFWQLALILINILTSLITIIAVGGIIWGALRYAASRDDSSAVNEAKTFIRNVLIGLVLYLAMWAIMQYIIPGGLFS